MPTRVQPSHYRPAIASMSLGRAHVHQLPHKLDMAAKYGFEGIELFYDDLDQHARQKFDGANPEHLIAAAKDIKNLCATRKLEVVCLQPFMHYEGLIDRQEHGKRLIQLRLWCKLARLLDTDLICIPSSFLSSQFITSDFDVLVSDIREAADVAMEQSPPIRLAYEALAWGTYIDTWEAAWNLVQRVNRQNVGICLDSFNMAARVYADPTSSTGTTPNADVELAASCKRLVNLVDVDKIFFVQIVDGERLEKPLLEGHEYFDRTQAARMSWSRNARCFYGETDRGAYLPITKIMETYLHGVGYRGWLSQELFSRTMSDPDASTPEQHASRAQIAWSKLVEDMKL